jgi:hypothetical protein
MKDSKKDGPKFVGFRKGTAKVVSFLHSDAHFVFKSLADMTAHSEAFWVNKLTGKEKSAVKEDRYNRTEQDQELILAVPGIIATAVTGLFKSKATVEDDIYHESTEAV